MAGVNYDITDATEAQEERERRLLRQKALSEATMQILAQDKAPGLLDTVALAARELIGARLASAGHGYANGQFLTGGASRAQDIPACPPGEVFALEKGGVYMEVIDSISSIRLTDSEMRRHPRWWGLPENHVPLNGLMAAPLLARDGSPNGMIMVSHKNQGDFSEEDEADLNQLAALTSLALQNLEARETLETRVKERTAELERRNLEQQRMNRQLGAEIEKRKRYELELKAQGERILWEHRQRAALSKKLVELLEKDRREISAALHDGIGQTLAGCLMKLDQLERETNMDELAPSIRDIRCSLSDSLTTAKTICHSLRSDILDRLGLVPAVRTLIEDMEERQKLPIRLFAKGVPEQVNGESALAVYRIIQESLANVVKHARAEEVFINLNRRGRDLIVTIEDDGTGFDPGSLLSGVDLEGPLGLLIMKERARQVGGRLHIESQAGKGTQIIAEIPLGDV
jgi:signal transduction histidine kinase